MYYKSPVSSNFFILSLFFINGPQALYVKSACLKCILGTNLSHANKKLLINSSNKRGPT